MVMPSSARPSVNVASTVPGYQKALDWLRSGPKGLLIGGRWVNAVSGKTFETLDPATEQTLAMVAEAGGADVDAAVISARRARDARQRRAAQLRHGARHAGRGDLPLLRRLAVQDLWHHEPDGCIALSVHVA